MAVYVSLVSTAWAAAPAQLFFDGIRYYKAGDYPSAIAAFSEIVKTGVRNGKLYYNLGNAYLKNRDTGHAVLWYLRARKLMPDDPDLKFNLNYALSLVKDAPEEGKSPVYGVLFFWMNLLSPRAVQWTAIGLNLVFWVFSAVRLIRKKRALNTVAVVILVAASVMTLTAIYNYTESASAKQAVILPEQVAVRSGLSENATELFVLHAGSRVRLEARNGEFVKIHFAKGKIGWIHQKHVGVI